jgi:hypothetical protein
MQSCSIPVSQIIAPRPTGLGGNYALRLGHRIAVAMAPLVGRAAELRSRPLHTMKPFTGLEVSFERMPSATSDGIVLRLRHMPTGVSIQRVVDSRRESHQRRDMLTELTKLVREFQKADHDNAV